MRPSANSFNYTGNSDPLERALFILQDVIVILNRKSIITYINKAGQQIFEGQLNYKPSIGDEFVSLLIEDKKESAKEFIDRAFCNETSVIEIHYPQSGNDSWFELGFYPMPEENGIVTHVCVRAKNITDKIILEKKLDKERKEQKNLLIKATFDAQEKQRTEIGRELHDNVNQVLTTVKLYNEICLTEEFTNKTMLMKSVQQINFCIESLRSLSKELSSPSID
ncbi:MAG: PAS domain-containing protein, partial [Flavisolibacter sp.]